MGFLSGRVTFERFRVGGRDLQGFDSRHVEIIDRYAIGKVGAVTADGTEVGFTAGNHILDLDFALEKNVINDTLHFAMRIDTNKFPGDLLKAYTELELSSVAANNPSGFPSRQQRREAREVAEQRCIQEAQTGKFRKMRQCPVLWDVRSGIIHFGGTSTNALERFVLLFKEAFGRSLTAVTSGILATEMAGEQGRTRTLEDLSAAVFVGSARKFSIAWISDQFGSRDFLGNEFLIWLWWFLDSQSDTIELGDGSTVSCMMNRTLTLECPANETGKETISSEAPTRLPEARSAIEAGKLPRKTGLMLVRQDQQYELTLAAETMTVGSASLPGLDSEPGRAELEDRIDQIRELTETIDLLFEVFCRRRLSSAWKEDLSGIREWIRLGD